MLLFYDLHQIASSAIDVEREGTKIDTICKNRMTNTETPLHNGERKCELAQDGRVLVHSSFFFAYYGPSYWVSLDINIFKSA